MTAVLLPKRRLCETALMRRADQPKVLAKLQPHLQRRDVRPHRRVTILLQRKQISCPVSNIALKSRVQCNIPIRLDRLVAPDEDRKPV